MERGWAPRSPTPQRPADFAVVLGKREVDAGTVTLKNLHTGEQQEKSLEEAIAEVARHGDR